MATAPYVPAKWQQPRRGEIRIIVVHCTISPEQGTGAEAVARYFRTVERPASAHLVTDNNSVVRCVPDNMESCGAAGANRDGLHLELVGYADQSAEQWMDAYGMAMFAQAKPFIRDWSELYDVPARWLTVAQVADGKSRGFCTHADVSKAFPAVSTGHTDPGKQFPKQQVMDLWFPPAPEPPEEDDMPHIVTCKDKPTRLKDGPTCSVIGSHTIASAKAAGVKTIDYSPTDYDALLKHVEDALGR